MLFRKTSKKENKLYNTVKYMSGQNPTSDNTGG